MRPMTGYLDTDRTPEATSRRITRRAIVTATAAAVLLVIWFVALSPGGAR